MQSEMSAQKIAQLGNQNLESQIDSKLKQKVDLKRDQEQNRIWAQKQVLPNNKTDIRLAKVGSFKSKSTRSVNFDPKVLMESYEQKIKSLIERPKATMQQKATNLPKFFLKIFFKNLPNFQNSRHNLRLMQFQENLQKSKNRYHLREIFNVSNIAAINEENRLNRCVIMRLLIRNYENILSNKHISNKRLYMIYSKRMMLGLNAGSPI